MSNEYLLKSLYILGVVFLAAIAYQLVASKNACEAAVTSYFEKYSRGIHSSGAKTARIQMDAICKAMGIEAQVYTKALGIQE